ncbi:MAG: AAA family ATPase [Bacteroidales bacterium]|nr:AAA family ATPase [Bacteroidales bacterium]
MPSLKKIVISDFRNISFQELSFSPNINCISGPNGSGKTNLIDAIYYISMTKSAFGTSDRYNFRHGTGEFSMCGSYLMENGLESKISVRTGSDAKVLKRDDKPYGRLSEHIGLIPIVLVSPSDVSLVSEGGEERRRFVNSVLSQMDPAYLSNVQQYERLLAGRNKLLKESSGFVDGDLMSVMDMRLSALASPIHEARRDFATKLSPLVAKYYEILSSGRESVCME